MADITSVETPVSPITSEVPPPPTFKLVHAVMIGTKVIPGEVLIASIKQKGQFEMNYVTGMREEGGKARTFTPELTAEGLKTLTDKTPAIILVPTEEGGVPFAPFFVHQLPTTNQESGQILVERLLPDNYEKLKKAGNHQILDLRDLNLVNEQQNLVADRTYKPQPAATASAPVAV